MFDHEGNQLLQITSEVKAPGIASRFYSVAVDSDGKIIAGDMHGGSLCTAAPPLKKNRDFFEGRSGCTQASIAAMCVHVFSNDGKTVCKFGKLGRGEGEFQTISNVACDVTASTISQIVF